MHADWIKSPTAHRILVHWADPRPAWLWSGDGQRLLWRNRAARYFYARVRKAGVRLAPLAVPIKGQVARLVRLGAVGRPSLSRIRFLAGSKPVSTTCTITPLEMADEALALLVVGVDPIEPDILDAGEGDDKASEALFPPGSEYLLLRGGKVAGGSAGVLDQLPPAALGDGIPQLPTGTEAIELDGWRGTVTRYKAGPDDAMLMLFVPAEGSIGMEAPDAAAGAPAVPQTEPEEPLLPMGLEPAPSPATEPTEAPEDGELGPAEERTSLVSLFDRLAGDSEFLAPLEPLDSVPPDSEPVEDADAETTIRAIIDFADEEEAEPAAGDPAVEDLPTLPDAPDPDTVERVSRYNFDELSRILNDRVGGEEAKLNAPPAEPPAAEVTPPPQVGPSAAQAAPPTPAPAAPAASVLAQKPPEGQLVNLAGDTFILNRLPLGILVFRDQQVLFANRSITEMIGYGSIDEIRTAGLAAIFPNAGPDAQAAGPVNHLVQRDGTLVPVTARLQSISWQGRPALMLSASTTEVRTGHESAVRAFAEHLAVARGEGFVETMRSGAISQISPSAIAMLGLERPVIGKPLTALVAPDAVPGLKRFLERPARFAETARPLLVTQGIKPGTELMVFAQGQAGVVSGYFVLLRAKGAAAAPVLPPPGDPAPSLLGRLSRSVRRPLNTIVGFADLIRSSAFGPIHNPRYIEYARDIKTAGMEIAALVDELDDFVRLKDGRYIPRLTDVDLRSLLDASAVRVRGQAGAARVLVRSAISERLPHVRIDRAALGQAVLNLLASAIDQTPVGGSVILSAQPNDDGSIAIHVRDSGPAAADPAERFVVFRDGHDRDGTALAPVRSTVGLALTRSLLEVNSCALTIDPAGGNGTLFSLVIPAQLVTSGVPHLSR